MGETSKGEGYSEDEKAYFRALGLDEKGIAELEKVVADAHAGADEEIKRRAEDPYDGLRDGMPDPQE
jgi:hypothetical protein